MDKYDAAVIAFKKAPKRILTAWENPSEYKHGCLFAFAAKKGYGFSGYGCLTQIKAGIGIAQTDEITTEIRQDERIPMGPVTINSKNLHVFAEWQRRLDVEYNRV